MQFSLGFPNEAWHKRLKALMVPIPGVGKVVLVQQDRGKYVIHVSLKCLEADTLIMATALVHDIINNYVPEGGMHATEVAT